MSSIATPAEKCNTISIHLPGQPTAPRRGHWRNNPDGQAHLCAAIQAKHAGPSLVGPVHVDVLFKLVPPTTIPPELRAKMLKNADGYRPYPPREGWLYDAMNHRLDACEGLLWENADSVASAMTRAEWAEKAGTVIQVIPCHTAEEVKEPPHATDPLNDDSFVFDF